MKSLNWFLLLILLMASFYTEAQQIQDSTHHNQKGIVDKLRDKLHDATTLNNPTDSLNIIKTDSSILLVNDSDSINQSSKLDSIQGLSRILPANLVNDSLSNLTEKPTEKAHVILDAPKEILTTTQDSVNNYLNRPAATLNERATTIQEGLENKILQSSEPLKDKTQQAIGSTQNTSTGMTEKMNNKATNITEKSGIPDLSDPDGLNGPTHLSTNMSEITPGIETSKLSSQISEVELGDPNLSFDHQSLDIAPLDMEMDDLIPSKDLDMPEIGESLNSIEQVDKLKSVSENISQLDGQLTEAGKIEEGIRKAKAGDTSELETQVAQLDQVKAIENETKQLTAKQAEYEALIEKYRDKKLQQEEIKRKAQNVVNEQFNKLSPAVQDAQEQFAKAKKLNPSVKSAKDMIKKRTNRMKGKPFRDRFAPGISLQAYHLKNVMIDVEVKVTYRLSGRFSIGLGGVYRVGFSEEYETLVQGLDIYGVRAHTDFHIKKGFYAHGDFEILHMPAYQTLQTPALEMRESSVAASYFGLGKQFNISKRVKGHMLGLYRVEYSGHIPGVNKFNFRLGFNYVLKKTKK